MIFNFVVSKEVCILYASLNLVGVRREFAKIDTIHRAVGSSENPGGSISKPRPFERESFASIPAQNSGGGGSLLSSGSDSPAFSKNLVM